MINRFDRTAAGLSAAPLVLSDTFEPSGQAEGYVPNAKATSAPPLNNIRDIPAFCGLGVRV